MQHGNHAETLFQSQQHHFYCIFIDHGEENWFGKSLSW